jgi:hypothetical protein
MGVGVAFGGHAVGRPPGVADADLRDRGWARGQGLFQYRDATLAPSQFETREFLNGDAGRVIASVFQPPETIEDDANRISLSQTASDDSTHGRRPRN